jgi:hypothetical protein
VTKEEIIMTLADERRVETMVENIAHRSLTDDLKDLCQMVYLILLEYDDAKIEDLWEHGQINFFIARILLNQYRSTNSPFYKLFRKYESKATDIETLREC